MAHRTPGDRGVGMGDILLGRVSKIICRIAPMKTPLVTSLSRDTTAGSFDITDICPGSYCWKHHQCCFRKLEMAFFFSFIFYFFIGVQLLYNVVLVSTVQQSASAICIHIFPLFWISFPFKLLQNIPCAIQQALISHLFYTQYQQCIYVNPHLWKTILFFF